MRVNPKVKKAKQKLFFVRPREHGNGGWCGSEVLAWVNAE